MLLTLGASLCLAWGAALPTGAPPPTNDRPPGDHT
ncbi:MAG: hypothetical protein ACI9HE_002058, partial [Planctomycetota bacterium]